ncbi:MAG TPA: DinB family protein [Vicinamibacterales bacterium]|nr:DinB family protein [Vicinamibacterales bacterium]
MTPEQAKAAADMLATVWEGEFPATCQVLAAVKNDKRDYKPDPKSRTAWELATHLATADIWFIDSILKGAFEWNPDAAKQAEGQFKSVDDVVEFYKTSFPEKLKQLRELPADKLTPTVSFFGMMSFPNVQFIGFANNHSIHHRGQLAAYLRAMGSKVPNIYGPSADAEG